MRSQRNLGDCLEEKGSGIRQIMTMESLLSFLQGFFLIPIIGGSVYSLLCLLAFWRFYRCPPLPSLPSFSQWPPVTLLKPVCGWEKNLGINLRSACLQDYPEFQVVFSVGEPDDPAVPLLKEFQEEYPEKVSVAVGNIEAGPNGKINNLLGALPHVRHNLLVISDSDTRLQPDYLKTIVAPLVDPSVGFVCTLYRATFAQRWFEKMELLTLNADFIPSVVFAYVSGASKFCLGSSVALWRESLKKMGGLETLADYLAEDYEMGRRLWVSGKRMVLVPYFVDIVVDLKDFSQWWNHQVCWDQKTRAAQPAGFFATIVTRFVPFALLFAAYRLGDALGLAILGGVIGLRLATAAVIMGWGFQDREGLKSLALLPLRDMVALVFWVLAFTKKTVVWRGSKLILTRGGRLARRESPQ
jgi:ceramide glucosyltransferase